METNIVPKSFFEGVENPQFKENYDYCLVTPINDNFEITYFNIPEKNLILLHESTGKIHVNKVTSVLFCLTPQSELMIPKLDCLVAVSRK